MIVHLKKIYSKYLHRKSLKQEFEYYNALSKKYQVADNYERLEYIIKVQTHGIEKGLSFRTPKEAFGVPKILVLIDNISSYFRTKISQEIAISITKFYELAAENHVELPIDKESA